jgi:hypothetical protein
MSRLNRRFARVACAITLVASACRDASTGPKSVALTSAHTAVAVASAPVFTHTLRVDDPAGDNTSPIDVRRMVMDFNPSTGNYQIIIAAPVSPFIGNFRVNVNLLNGFTGVLFSDNVRDFGYTSPVALVRLAGTNSLLSTWAAGHNIQPSRLNPPPGFQLFWSAVTTLPCACNVSEDAIAFANRDQPAQVTLLSAEGSLAHLADLVGDLELAGQLTPGQASALIAKIDGAAAKLSSGHAGAAANQLQAFLNQLGAFARGSVGEAEAAILRSVALQVHGAIGG